MQVNVEDCHYNGCVSIGLWVCVSYEASYVTNCCLMQHYDKALCRISTLLAG